MARKRTDRAHRGRFRWPGWLLALWVLLALGWSVRTGWRAWGARGAEQWISQYGGVVYRAYELSESGGAPAGPKTPPWLAEVFAGELVLDPVVGVRLEGSPSVLPEELRHLDRLPELRHVILRVGTFDDRHAAELGRLTRLRALDLAGSRVGDAGAAALVGLAELEYLNLARSEISGACVKHLAELGALRALQLEETSIDGEDLAALAGLPHLRVLSVAGGVGKSGSEILGDLPALEQVYFFGGELGVESMDPLIEGKAPLNVVGFYRMTIPEAALARLRAAGITVDASGGERPAWLQ